MRIAMRTPIAVVFVLLMVGVVPLQAQGNCACNRNQGIFDLATSQGLVFLAATIAYLDQSCISGRVSTGQQLDFYEYFFLAFRGFESWKSNSLSDAGRNEQAPVAEQLIKDCVLQVWTRLALDVDKDAAPPPPIPIPFPPVNCSCELLVRVGNKLKPVKDGLRASRNDLVELQANCLPPGGTFEWSTGVPPPSTAQDITPGTGIQWNGGKAVFLGERRTTTRVFAKYTTADGRMCTVERQVVVE